MGFAYPTSQLENNLLSSLNQALDKSWLESQLGIRKRSSSLPLEYIRSSGNVDHKLGQASALQSPTDLSSQAAEMALRAAGIGADQLGLILAECATPLETTPFESQRIGKRLNVKIPAFDVFSGSGSLSLYLDLLKHRRVDLSSQYSLCVSSNTPTQRVDYKTGRAAAYFGDAAAAFVVSAQQRGKLKVLASEFRSDPFAPQPFSVETYGSVHIDEKVVENQLMEQFRSLFTEACAALGLDVTRIKLVLNHPSPRLASKLVQEWKMPAGALLEVVGERGYSFGATSACALAEYWPKIQAVDRILVLECAGNLGEGYVLCEAQN